MAYPTRSDSDSPDPAVAPAPARVGPVVREGLMEVPGELVLHHGGRLTGVHVAWRLEGPAGAPVVTTLGGISAHRRVYGENAAEGWWNEVVGPGRALDASRVRILSFDYLGGSGEPTGPRGDAIFPHVSTYDQAGLLLRLANHLGIAALHAIVGASYGGMVALAFAERYPERVAAIVVVSAADRTHPMATAWRSVHRRVLRFAADCGRAADGVAIARALAMSTYRSPEEFAARFSGAPRLEAGSAVFTVEE